MPAVNKTTKMLQYIDTRVRITTNDGRCLVGNFLAFDRHMNMVLAQTEEFRQLRKSKRKKLKEEDVTTSTTESSAEERRTLGLVVLRGEIVVSIQLENHGKTGKAKTSEHASTVPGVVISSGMPMPVGVPPVPIGSAPPLGLGRGMHMPPAGIPPRPPRINMFGN